MSNSLEDFFQTLSGLFSAYDAEMKSAIISEFEELPESKIYDLLNAIKKHWDKKSPPPLAAIIKIAKENNIILSVNKSKLISICEFCYQGIKNVKGVNGRMYPETPGHKSEWPKKIVEVSENTSWICPICSNRVARGLCMKRSKKIKKVEVRDQVDDEEPGLFNF